VAAISAALFLLVIGLAACCDWRWRKIPNWLTWSGMLLGVLANGVLGPLTWLKATQGLLLSAGAAYLAGSAMQACLPWHLAHGDLKLAAVIGAFLGAGPAVLALLGGIILAIVVVELRGLDRMPAGPALAIAGVITLAFRSQIASLLTF